MDPPEVGTNPVSVLVQCLDCDKVFTPRDGLNIVLTCKCGKPFHFLARFFDRGEWMGWEGKFRNWYVTSDKKEIRDILNKRSSDDNGLY